MNERDMAIAVNGVGRVDIFHRGMTESLTPGDVARIINERDALQRENEALREALMHIYEVTHPEIESATDPNTVEDVWVTAGLAIRCWVW